MTAPLRHIPSRTAHIFAWPLAIAVASLAGLVAALVGDGAWDALSWLLLGGGVAIVVRCLLR